MTMYSIDMLISISMFSLLTSQYIISVKMYRCIMHFNSIEISRQTTFISLVTVRTVYIAVLRILLNSPED